LNYTLKQHTINIKNAQKRSSKVPRCIAKTAVLATSWGKADSGWRRYKCTYNAWERAPTIV